MKTASNASCARTGSPNHARRRCIPGSIRRTREYRLRSGARSSTTRSVVRHRPATQISVRIGIRRRTTRQRGGRDDRFRETSYADRHDRRVHARRPTKLTRDAAGTAGRARRPVLSRATCRPAHSSLRWCCRCSSAGEAPEHSSRGSICEKYGFETPATRASCRGACALWLVRSPRPRLRDLAPTPERERARELEDALPRA